MIRDALFGEEEDSDVRIESWESRNTHIVTARVQAENIRDAKAAFRRLIYDELKLDMNAGSKIYAEDNEFGVFECIIVLTSRDRPGHQRFKL